MLVPLAFVCLGWRVPPVGKFDSVRTAPFHPAVHNLGNVGPLGRVHARGARAATWVIDQLAYAGVNMRREVAQQMATRYDEGTRLLEVGCGVGTLTRELEEMQTFDIVAVDTSQEMLDRARKDVNCTFLQKNGVDFEGTVDVSILCMVMHEMPQVAHRDMLAHLLRITTTAVWIVDIDPGYTPSPAMLSGEPYVPQYLETIESTIDAHATGRTLESLSPIVGHVRAWVIGPRAG